MISNGAEVVAFCAFDADYYAYVAYPFNNMPFN